MVATAIPNFAAQLSTFAGRDVIDKTGIAGSFDIRVDVTAEDLAAGSTYAAGEAALALGAVRRLEMSLESEEFPGEKLVIEHVHMPSAN